MRLVIAGGGTGGHLFPGLALAEETLARGGEVLFVGCGRKIEDLALSEVPFPVKTLRAEGLIGRPLKDKLRALVKMCLSVGEALKILKTFKPQGVFGVGGYASVPTILAAKILRLPCAIHEQNSVPGVANRFLGRLASKIFVSFPKTVAYFPRKKTIFSGNPVRRSILEPRIREHQGLGLLVTGGSQGARALNRLMLQVAPRLYEHFPDLFLIHQTGFADADLVEASYASHGLPVRVYPFIKDMAWAYAQVDLVLCRAGATTIAELCALGKPAIYIPFPYATHRHQEENAKAVVERGAGLMFREKDLNPDELFEAICGLLEDKRRREQMSAAAQGLFPKEALQIIVSQTEALIAHA